MLFHSSNYKKNCTLYFFTLICLYRQCAPEPMGVHVMFVAPNNSEDDQIILTSAKNIVRYLRLPRNIFTEDILLISSLFVI